VVAVVALLAFAAALARAPPPYVGRTFAAHAGVYLLGALGWMGLIDRSQPDRWDIIGACLSLAGAAVILYVPRGAPSPVQ
jgi:small multidrug resistance family-3 protein